MAILHYQHHSGISFLKPSWLLRPPTTKATTKRPRYATAAVAAAASSSSPHTNKKTKLNKFSGAADPSSPRIGCMGQIKGNLPRTKPAVSKEWNSPLSKLIRVFFGPRVNPKACSRVRDIPRHVAVDICVAEMDPPLPVLRKHLRRDEDSISLWERRCRDSALKGLQLKSIALLVL